MNKINNKYLIVLVSLLSVTACKKQLDVNLSNPNGVTSAQITGKDVFPNAVQITSTEITNSYSFASEWMGYLARTTSYSQSGQEQQENFALQNSLGDGIWQAEYHNIYDYNFVVSNSAANSILPGAASVMKALIFQNLVDVFGDVPYSAAGNPNVSTQPKYDVAADIYKGLITDINAGITKIKASSATGDDASDIVFKGDKTKWVQFANTLKLRILMRMVPNGDQTFVKAALADIATEGTGYLVAGEDVTANPGYTNAEGKQNPFWASFGYEVNGGAKNNHTYYIANKTMIDYLNATSDPRQGYLYDTTGGKISGNYLGAVSTTNPVATLATIGSGILKNTSSIPAATQPAVIMLASQSFFLQAEAAQRGLLSGNSSTLLQTAIEESFKYLGLSTAAADAFYTNSKDATVNPANGAPLKAIMYQKWVALTEIDGLESWAEYRRTGFPDRTNPSVSSGVSAADNVVPKRLLYPQSEYNLNSKNVRAENQTADGFTTKIFWGQ